jgi:hypothetical protein
MDRYMASMQLSYSVIKTLAPRYKHKENGNIEKVST